MSAATSEGLAWTRDIPIVNNRHVWIHWGWAVLLFVGLFSVAFGAGAALLVPDSDLSAGTVVRIYLVLVIVVVGFIIGMGLFGALSMLNKVTSNFTLDAVGARSEVELYSGKVVSLAWRFGEKRGEATGTAAGVGMLLPESGYYEWKDIRGADYDSRRCVVTLRRGWHRQLHLYTTPENYEEVAAFVHGHVDRPATGAPRETATR